jgi:hypothetical protein
MNHVRVRTLPTLPTVTLLVAVLLTTLSVGACTILYATTSSPENLLCGPVGGPRCDEGFACVRNASDEERCVRAGFKAVGEACGDSAECADGGVCADAYAELCPDDSTDINCDRTANSDTGLRCRAACDESFSCGNNDDDRCFFFEGIDPFCQKGTCATDSDCEGAAVPAFCVGERNGLSGFCSVACDPLGCFDNSSCTCTDTEACAMPVDEFVVSTRNVCGPIGVIEAPNQCDVLNPCVDGSSCVFRNDGSAVCVQWCRVGGGAPGCEGGVCQNVVQGSPLGICQ